MTEWVTTRTCDNVSDFEVLDAASMYALREWRKSQSESDLKTLLTWLRRGDISVLTDVECRFTGEVDATFFGKYVMGWTCPLCGAEHEETNDDPPGGVAYGERDENDY
jgi:hypothetical protein